MIGFPKGLTRRQIKAKKDRWEDKLIAIVRTECQFRDGYCRLGGRTPKSPCQGPPTWAHLKERKRSKTRKMDPEYRHSTRYSLILCLGHHNRYDDASDPLDMVYGEAGANGPIVLVLGEDRYPDPRRL